MPKRNVVCSGAGQSNSPRNDLTLRGEDAWLQYRKHNKADGTGDGLHPLVRRVTIRHVGSVAGKGSLSGIEPFGLVFFILLPHTHVVLVVSKVVF